MVEKNTVIKYAGNTLGVGTGNGIAYFALPYAEKFQGFPFEDPAVAVAFGGVLIGVFFLELGKIGRGLKYVFDRVFPASNDKEE